MACNKQGVVFDWREETECEVNLKQHRVLKKYHPLDGLTNRLTLGYCRSNVLPEANGMNVPTLAKHPVVPSTTKSHVPNSVSQVVLVQSVKSLITPGLALKSRTAHVTLKAKSTCQGNPICK